MTYEETVTDAGAAAGIACELPRQPDMGQVTVVNLVAGVEIADYVDAMAVAGAEAARRLGEYMLLAWYDRERDFESPQHAGECHLDSAVPGYVDYALSHGATLRIDFDDGRFVFFYLPV
jgi:hypothetical protein